MLTRFIFHSSTPSAQGLTELSAAATTPPAKEVSIGDVAKEADGRHTRPSEAAPAQQGRRGLPGGWQL